MAITRLSGGSTPADGSDPRTFPAIWNPTADVIDANESDIAALQTLVGDNNLNDINDVAITAPADGQFLVYDNGDWVNSVPAGSILQVVTDTEFHTTTDFTTGTFTASEVELSITPTSASSTILIYVTTPAQSYLSGDGVFQWQLYRDGSGIGPNPLITSNIIGNSQFRYSSSNAFEDAPATTSAITYNLRYRRSSGAGTLRISTEAPWSMFLLEKAG